jgi:hypothetical protein
MIDLCKILRNDCSVDTLNQFISESADINCTDKKERTPLHVALSFRRSDDIIETLIANGAKLNCVDYKGRTPFHIAACYNNKKGVDILAKHLKERDNLNNQIENIVKNCDIGDIESLQFILSNRNVCSKGILTYFSNRFSSTLPTLMDFAIRHGRVDVMDWLLVHHQFPQSIQFNIHNKIIEKTYDLEYALNNDIQDSRTLLFIMKWSCPTWIDVFVPFEIAIEEIKNRPDYNIINSSTYNTLCNCSSNILRFIYRKHIEEQSKTICNSSIDIDRLDSLLDLAILKKNYFILEFLLHSFVTSVFVHEAVEKKVNKIVVTMVCNKTILNISLKFFKHLLEHMTNATVLEVYKYLNERILSINQTLLDNDQYNDQLFNKKERKVLESFLAEIELELKKQPYINFQKFLIIYDCFFHRNIQSNTSTSVKPNMKINVALSVFDIPDLRFLIMSFLA